MSRITLVQIGIVLVAGLLALGSYRLAQQLGRPPLWFEVMIHRLAGCVLGGLGLVCAVSAIVSVHAKDFGLAAFLCVPAAILLGLCYLYLKVLVSRARRRAAMSRGEVSSVQSPNKALERSRYG